MTFELYDYGKINDKGQSALICTIEAASFDEARNIAKKEHDGIALYLFNEQEHGFVDGAG